MFFFEKISQVADLGFAPFAHLIDNVSSEKTPKKQVGCHDVCTPRGIHPKTP